MGDWYTHVNGEKVTPAEQDEWVQEKLFATLAERNAASVGWGSAEIFRQCKVVETGFKYYWTGASWQRFPAEGGAGAPVDATYVTTKINDQLTGEVLHQSITDDDYLHVPKVHKASHQDGGSDEISVAGLSGLLADEQNAGKIKGKTVDDSGIADGKLLGYNSATGNIEYKTAGAPGAHATTHQNGESDEINVAGLSGELADNQPPKAHKTNHVSGGSDAFLSEDDLDANARVGVRLTTGGTTYERRRIRFEAGSGASLNVSEDADNEESVVNISATAVGTYKLTHSYIIYKVGSYYYAMDKNGSIYDSGLNQDTVTQSAINALTSGGTIFLQELQLGSVTYGNNILIIEDYQGYRTIYFNQAKRETRSSSGTAIGKSPITVAHGLGSAPSQVFVTPKALQPYVCSCNWDATNIYIYHNAAAGLNVSWRAQL